MDNLAIEVQQAHIITLAIELKNALIQTQVATVY